MGPTLIHFSPSHCCEPSIGRIARNACLSHVPTISHLICRRERRVHSFDSVPHPVYTRPRLEGSFCLGEKDPLLSSHFRGEFWHKDSQGGGRHVHLGHRRYGIYWSTRHQASGGKRRRHRLHGYQPRGGLVCRVGGDRKSTPLN